VCVGGSVCTQGGSGQGEGGGDLWGGAGGKRDREWLGVKIAGFVGAWVGHLVGHMVKLGVSTVGPARS
jgi:hypothetical protein